MQGKLMQMQARKGAAQDIAEVSRHLSVPTFTVMGGVDLS